MYIYIHTSRAYKYMHAGRCLGQLERRRPARCSDCAAERGVAADVVGLPGCLGGVAGLSTAQLHSPS